MGLACRRIEPLKSAMKFWWDELSPEVVNRNAFKAVWSKNLEQVPVNSSGQPINHTHNLHKIDKKCARRSDRRNPDTSVCSQQEAED